MGVVSQWSNMLLHDLKNYLTPLRLVAQNIRTYKDRPDIAEIASQDIDQVAGRMEALVRRLATLRENPELSRTEIDLDSLVQTTLDELQAASRTTHLNLALHARVPVVGDESMIKRVVENLVTNAIEAMNGEPLSAFVAGIGTGGTITGAGEVLKQHYNDIKIVGVEPATSAVLSGNPPGPHKIQGIGAGFKPKVLNMDIVDRILPVTDEDAFAFSQRLAKEEGLLVGISSGAAGYAAYKLAEELGPGKSVVAIMPDSGERYFSFYKYFN